jgi:ribokinase
MTTDTSPSGASGHAKRPDLLVFGNLIVDDVVLLDGTTRMNQPGGAVIYAALGAAVWGARIGLVSRVGDDYPPSALEALASRGVLLDGVRPLGRAGIRSWILYEARGRQMVHQIGSPTHAEATPRPVDVPAGWFQAPAALVSPSPLPVQRTLLDALAAQGTRLLGVDPHTPVTEATLADWRATLERVDVFFVSESELKLGPDRPAADSDAGGKAFGTPLRAGEMPGDHPIGPLARLAGGRLKTILLKCGERGGILYEPATRRVTAWRGHAAAVVDPTGAGDAFAGGFLAALGRGEPLPGALACGVVSASFAVEAWGVDALLAARRDDAERRRLEWFPEASRF